MKCITQNFELDQAVCLFWCPAIFRGEDSRVFSSFHLSDTWWSLSSIKATPYKTKLKKCELSMYFSPSREGHWNIQLTVFMIYPFFSWQVNYDKGTSLQHKCLYIYVLNTPKNSCIQKTIFHLIIRYHQRLCKIIT